MLSGWKSQWRLPAFLLILSVLALAKTPIRAQEQKPRHLSVTPAPRKEANWVKRHEAFVERAKKGDVDVLFLGDSITQGWEGNGKQIWQERYAPLKAANFGIGGDQTQHVLW